MVVISAGVGGGRFKIFVLPFFPRPPHLVFYRPSSQSATGISFDRSHGPGAPVDVCCDRRIGRKKWNAITGGCDGEKAHETRRIGSETLDNDDGTD